jgi:hypothetical protein
MNIKYVDIYQDIFFNIFKHFEIYFLVVGASTPVSRTGFPSPVVLMELVIPGRGEFEFCTTNFFVENQVRTDVC